jgi:hypothetical protein
VARSALQLRLRNHSVITKWDRDVRQDAREDHIDTVHVSVHMHPEFTSSCIATVLTDTDGIIA